MKKAVIALSGGMDSVTLLGHLLEQGYSVLCVNFYYGSKHGKYEKKAAKSCYSYYLEIYKNKLLGLIHIDLTNVFKHCESSLLLSGESIPEGDYREETMKSTVVPGRNLVLSSIISAIAESKGIKEITLGVHAGDHYIYPDCRPGFISALGNILKHSTEGAVNVNAPFLYRTKTEILKLGLSMEITVPYHLTRTCYKDQPIACGKCGSCNERLASFEEVHMKDPIKYENNG